MFQNKWMNKNLQQNSIWKQFFEQLQMKNFDALYILIQRFFIFQPSFFSLSANVPLGQQDVLSEQKSGSNVRFVRLLGKFYHEERRKKKKRTSATLLFVILGHRLLPTSWAKFSRQNVKDKTGQQQNTSQSSLNYKKMDVRLWEKKTFISFLSQRSSRMIRKILTRNNNIIIITWW